MSKGVAVTVIVEGDTEQIFVREILAPYLGAKGVFMTPIILSKPGQKGGDVRFARAKNDISRHLKQRKDAYVSLLVDYYGIGADWPGLKAVKPQASPGEIAAAVCKATQQAIEAYVNNDSLSARFVPHISVYEFEALLFSESAILAGAIQVDPQRVEAIIEECGEPEAINNSGKTAPSKRIEELHSKFKKTSDGIAIARAIGIERMRAKCPVFNCWLDRLESLVEGCAAPT
ncbi:MAG: DUF4276 family protein [Gammaproteobacteria bacterium]|nr:DUF4276 family protein [Gammaproteobacteria bacterium]MDE0270957.1 DUF4276 family protein [Gammaproteobacteria bacterium]